MAAGDISTGLVTKLRAIFNESSAGFLNSTDPYTFLDTAQNFIIDSKILKVSGYQNKNQFYEDIILEAILSSSSVAWDTSANSITLPSNKYILYAELYKSATGDSLPITRLGYEETLLRKNNYYSGHSISETTGKGQVFYYVGSKLFTSYPTGTHSTFYDKITILYIAPPSTISSSVDPALSSLAHDAMIQYALFLAFTKKGDERAKLHFQNFINFMNQ